MYAGGGTVGAGTITGGAGSAETRAVLVRRLEFGLSSYCGRAARRLDGLVVQSGISLSWSVPSAGVGLKRTIVELDVGCMRCRWTTQTTR